MSSDTQARDQEWVVALLRQFCARKDSDVVMTNIHGLAEVLMDELFLNEWFEQWEDPPSYLSANR
jgi:hypothetical protein